MAVTLRALEVAVPETVLHQDEVRDIFASQPGISRLATRLVNASFNASGIETRHSAVAEMDLQERPESAEAPHFFDSTNRHILNPSTRVRNDVYVDEATQLYVDAAAAAVTAWAGIGNTVVTHGITVSCTGIFSQSSDNSLRSWFCLH